MRGVLVWVSAASVLFAVGCGSSGSETSSDARPFVDALVDDMTTADESDDFVVSEDEAGCLAPRIVEIVGVDAIERSQATPEEFGEAGTLSELNISVDSRGEERIADAMIECVNDDSFSKAFADQVGLEQMPETCTEFQSMKTLAPPIAAGYVRESGYEEITDLFASAPGACAERLMLSGAVAEGALAIAQADCIADRLDDDDAQAIWRAKVLAEDNAWTTENPELARILQDAVSACD